MNATINLKHTLPKIDDCPPFGHDDQQCFAELRDVLERHGKLSRFGITLLHQHFQVAEDEILLETCDPVNRVLTIRPELRANHPSGTHRETNWRLDTQSAIQECTQICKEDSDGHHCGSVHW